MAPDPLSAVEDREAAVQHDRQGDDGEERQEQDEQCRGNDDVECAFRQGVLDGGRASPRHRRRLRDRH